MSKGLGLFEDLRVDPTAGTLGIEFSYAKGQLRFFGKSYPDNSKQFFEPLLAWIENITQSGHQKIRIEFAVSYFNTSSSKYLFQIMLRLKQFEMSGNQVDFVWYQSDNDQEMVEVWKEIMEEIQLPYTVWQHQ